MGHFDILGLQYDLAVWRNNMTKKQAIPDDMTCSNNN